jgi:hypothetical protein
MAKMVSRSFVVIYYHVSQQHNLVLSALQAEIKNLNEMHIEH